MKIGLISRIFDPGRGGLERFHVNLAGMMTAKGEDVTVFAEKWAGLPDAVMNRVMVRKSGNFLAPNSVRFADAVRKKVNPDKFDCLIANTPYYPCDIHRAGGGIHKFWYKMRGEEWGGFYRFAAWQPRYRFALRLERNIYGPGNVKFQIANSRLVKNQMVRYYNFPEDRIAVVYNGIDFEKFNISWCERNRKRLRKEMDFSEKDFVILFPSNNFRRKGFNVLTDAVKRAGIGGNAIILALGQDRPKAKDARIRFPGHREKILPYYAVCDCLVLPTLYEPCSNVVLEAMACGRVAVTSPTNGACEFITNGHDGFVLNSYKDVNQLAGIIEQLYNDRNGADEMGWRAFETVKGYTLERNANQIMKLCTRAMENGKSISSKD
jgi:UDP-glucose:(heptosyl)LPS alpha-1,3-glucosyltransferase